MNFNQREFKAIANDLGVSGSVLDGYVGSVNKSGILHPMAVRTPYIVEETSSRYTQMDVFSKLMADRIIWCSGGVDNYMSDVVSAQLMYMAQSDPNKEIKLYVNSPGGSVYAGLTMIDMMNLVKNGILTGTDTIIQTVNLGLAASMGSVLLANGSKGHRFAMENSRTMLHQSSGGTGGNIQDAAVSYEEWKRLNTTLAQMLADLSGHTIDKILADTNRDFWLMAEEAKAYGLVDGILSSTK